MAANSGYPFGYLAYWKRMLFIAPVEDSPVPLIGLAYIMSLPLNQAVILVRVADGGCRILWSSQELKLGQPYQIIQTKRRVVHREERQAKPQMSFMLFKVVYFF